MNQPKDTRTVLVIFSPPHGVPLLLQVVEDDRLVRLDGCYGHVNVDMNQHNDVTELLKILHYISTYNDVTVAYGRCVLRNYSDVKNITRIVTCGVSL